ncbi:MAG: HAD-IC family P-type ATPase, partial [Parasporobacterium sp.]|nr:HAD-IC family P-type ATPase [Parasporobacterium sp.]
MYTEEELKKKTITGLTFPEVEERIKAGQVNGDMNVKTKTIKQIIKDNLFTLFNLINLILFVCIIISGSLKNGLFFLVVIWNFLIGVIQEVRAKKTIDKLSILSAPKAHVLRNGEVQTIPVKDIVLGDVMELKNGHQICADAVVLKGSCQVNESLITGESTPIVKNPGDHILSGSYLVSGYVLAEVEHIGADNYVNKITLGAKYFKKSNSIIMDSVKKIVKVVGIAILPLAALMIWKNFFSISQPFSDAMVAVVASVSAMIPGGLVLLVSIVLAVSVVKLSRHKTLVQDLYSVENLARVDVICLDKTGTITEGVMQVEEIIPAEGCPDVPFAEAGEEGHMEAIKLFAAMMVDENSTIEAVRGALTELPAVAVTDELKNSSSQVPFSSDRKWSSLYIEGKGTILMGAPERVCPDYVKEGTEAHALIAGHIENSRRVVVIAYSPEKGVEENLPSGIKPLCFIVIGDRVRANAKKTLQYFAEQDVTIKVISGDNPVTVSKVAFEAGLEGADKYIDASGIDSYEEIEKIVDEYTIFGRVTPYQKLDLVKALKAKGHTVAMTGDGANDVLALKEADCSIAMQSGSDAARNVANMVLLDSDFASLPLVVAEGRKAINNLQRSSALY